MRYFYSAQAHDLALAVLEDAVTTNEEALATAARAGVDLRDFMAVDIDETKRKRDESKREHERVESEHRDALFELQQQATTDARVAWEADESFFAPVLFQPLKRDGVAWEVALQAITAVGWRLDSWQVIGSGPPPFGGNVTLIQTLFTRPHP